MNPLDPTTTTRLLALPSLREQAESEYASRVQTQVQDLAMQRAARLRGTEVEARLLASMDWYGQAWALREIGRLLGWDCGDRVPALEQVENWTCAGYEVRDGANRWAPRISLAGMDRPNAIAAILLHLSEGK